MAEPHVADFKARFAYAFEDTGYVGTRPQVTLAPFGNAPFAIGALTVDPAMVPHGHMRTAAFRFGRFAYATDFKAFPAELEARWRGKIDVMVASGIHFAAHPTHSSVGETTALFGHLGVKRGIITHLAHEVLHARDGAALPRASNWLPTGCHSASASRRLTGSGASFYLHRCPIFRCVRTRRSGS